MANGQTQLTRIPSAPHSSAAVRLNRRTAALALEYAARPASPSTPAPELKFTMLPPWARSSG